jgi:hypothetical protein
MRGGFFFVDVGVKRYVKMCDTHPLRASATFFCVDLWETPLCFDLFSWTPGLSENV